MSRKSRTASYLALGRIWHDTSLQLRVSKTRGLTFDGINEAVIASLLSKV